MEIGFPLVGGEKGLKGSIIRARVFERKPKHKKKLSRVLEWFVDHRENFERAIPKSNHPQKI